MISNKYGFIYIHTPKTGGTSVSSQLYRDTDQECEIVYEDDGEGIAALYPSSEDFPWWWSWVQYTVRSEELTRSLGEVRTVHLDGAAIFSATVLNADLGGGNIKHLTISRWLTLLHDPRFTNYGSFRNQYVTIGSCRNPYTREFSWFWYLEGARVLSELEGSSDKRIEKTIREEWEKWVLTTEQGEFERRGPSQSHYLCTPSIHECTPKGEWVLPSVDPTIRIPPQRATHLIRMEHIEEDYNNICNILSIPRKSSTLPHKLNLSAGIRKYVPDDILEWYTAEMLDIIHEGRRQDFDVLPYEMGRPLMTSPEG